MARKTRALGKGGAKRVQAGGDADQVEEISVLAGGAFGPLAGNARWREADKKRAPLGAANIAGGPVPALLAAVGEVSPADFLGVIAKSGGDERRPRSWHRPGDKDEASDGERKSEALGTSLAAAGDVPVAAPLRLSAVPNRRSVREARAAPCGRLRLGPDYGKKGPAPCRLSARERPS